MIDKQIVEQKKKHDREEKILLLGAGESGKSTFLKQMKILHCGGFSSEEMELYKNTVVQNAIISCKCLVQGMEQLGIPIQMQENQNIADELLDLDPLTGNEGGLTPTVARKISQLWSDPGVKEAYKRNNEFIIQDTAAYFLDNIEKIADFNFQPGEADILYSRVKTTGIVEVEFVVDESHFRVVDVGGQRSERKKWINCFDDVTCVIFFVALSEYDQFLREDETVNRMKESLSLWEEIANHPIFKDTSMILFLNKVDLFQEKLKTSPITTCFPEYKGKNTFDAASKYMRERFIELRHQNRNLLRCHFTCTTDTTNVKTIFENVKEIIVQDSLERSGLK